MFGRLTILSRAPKVGFHTYWRCRCECGIERSIRPEALKAGITKSCGCLNRDITIGKAKERAGDVIGRHIAQWTVLELLPRRARNGGVYFLCLCDCGQSREVAADGLLAGRSRSCGTCGSHRNPICKAGHNVAEWGGRTPSGSCKACVKEKSMRRNYGLTLNEYLSLWDLQGGRCAICQKQLDKAVGVPGWQSQTESSTRHGRPEVDHEHGHKDVSKRYVRGILCGGRWSGCNRKIGRIDHIEWLKSVVDYLENPPAQQLFGKDNSTQ